MAAHRLLTDPYGAGIESRPQPTLIEKTVKTTRGIKEYSNAVAERIVNMDFFEVFQHLGDLTWKIGAAYLTGGRIIPQVISSAGWVVAKAGGAQLYEDQGSIGMAAWLTGQGRAVVLKKFTFRIFLC